MTLCFSPPRRGSQSQRSYFVLLNRFPAPKAFPHVKKVYFASSMIPPGNTNSLETSLSLSFADTTGSTHGRSQAVLGKMNLVCIVQNNFYNQLGMMETISIKTFITFIEYNTEENVLNKHAKIGKMKMMFTKLKLFEHPCTDKLVREFLFCSL